MAVSDEGEGEVTRAIHRIFSLDDLRSNGLLWLINRAVFHPRGFALAVVYGPNDDVIGLEVKGDGSEPWAFSESMEERENECFEAVEAFFARLRDPDATIR